MCLISIKQRSAIGDAVARSLACFLKEHEACDVCCLMKVACARRRLKIAPLLTIKRSCRHLCGFFNFSAFVSARMQQRECLCGASKVYLSACSVCLQSGSVLRAPPLMMLESGVFFAPTREMRANTSCIILITCAWRTQVQFTVEEKLRAHSL